MATARPLISRSLFLVLVAGALAAFFAGDGDVVPALSSSEITLESCGDGEGTLCGTLQVFENREAATGRKISLKIRVLPASKEPRQPDPVFLLAGGPGQAATSLMGWARRQWLRDPQRDLVLVDQRGTGGSNGLRCEALEGAEDPFSVMDSVYDDPEVLTRCRDDLMKEADLRLYTTPLAMDDLDEIRRGLGYDRINIVGGSYGSRAGLVYLRRHGEHVRAAVLWGPAPLANTLPLYHSRGGQRALDLLVGQCDGQSDCSKSYPDLHRKLDEILTRLEKKPARVTLKRSGGPQEIVLTRDGFAEGVRIMMYTVRGGRRIPQLVDAAHRGDYEPFARVGVRSLGGILDQLDLGMLLSVVCAEDLPRVDPARISELTGETFLGGRRVRAMVEMCEDWPRGEIDQAYGRPVRSDRPVLVISGNLDPVTPPEWGEEMVRHLSRGQHVVVPRAHDVNSPCVEEFASAWLFGDPEKPADASCVEGMTLPRFEVN